MHSIASRLIALLSLLGAGCRAPGAPEAVSIQWPATLEGRAAVQVRGLGSASLARMQAELATSGSLTQSFGVFVDSGQLAPAMAGSYRVEQGALYFRPSFDWTPNLAYVARLQLEDIAGPTSLLWKHTFHAPRPSPSTRVSQLFPSAELLPQNVLRMYLHFSAPMRRGQAYTNIRILDEAGDPLQEPFIPLPQELWDPTSTRLTLLFDPGRIKRGLLPNRELGAPLEAGRNYTLVVDSAWQDARGIELAAAFVHAFRTLDSDREQPSLATWRLTPPRAESLEALRIDFLEALDHGQLGWMISVHSSSGEQLAGEVSIALHEMSWSFQPDLAWQAGDYELVINPLLEDLAGNSFARAFEVDLRATPVMQSASQPLRLAFAVVDA